MLFLVVPERSKYGDHESFIKPFVSWAYRHDSRLSSLINITVVPLTSLDQIQDQTHLRRNVEKADGKLIEVKVVICISDEFPLSAVEALAQKLPDFPVIIFSRNEINLLLSVPNLSSVKIS